HAASARVISALSLHDALPILLKLAICACRSDSSFTEYQVFVPSPLSWHTNTCCPLGWLGFNTTALATADEQSPLAAAVVLTCTGDLKSTRLNSSHTSRSSAVS